MTNSYKKESPLAGFAGFGGGAPGLSYKSAAVKTYVDDVFSTTLWKGTGSSKDVINNIDLSGQGGFTWIKNRTINCDHMLYDTVRGATKFLSSNDTGDEGTETGGITSFNSVGFTVGGNGESNQGNAEMSSWSFRKAPGFFDVVEYTGTGSKRTVDHSLGCVPGMIVIKRTDQSGDNWDVWHKSLLNYPGESTKYYVQLNTTNAQSATSRFGLYGTDDPTSTTFTVKNQSEVNASGGTYIAYVFASGDTGLRNSVDLDGNDYLTYADDEAWQLGTDDWTMECFWKSGSGNTGGYQQLFGTQTVWGPNDGVWRVGTRTTSDQIYFSRADGSGFEEPVWNIDVNDESWHHLAFTRASGYVYCWVDGVQQTNVGESNNITGTMTTSNSFRVGHNGRDGTYNTGKVSNLRIIKGRALYTNGSNFTTPTEPLPTVEKTIFLGCDASIVTSSSLSAKVPTVTGNPTVSTDNPFTTDAAGAVFGADEDKDIIKVGSYTGNGSSSGPEINLGWEPQYVLIKGTGNIDDWILFDSMRGVPTGGDDSDLRPNDWDGESTSSNYLDITSTGFKLTLGQARTNNSGVSYIYMAIRGTDGGVAKPPAAGTDSFNVVLGAGNATIPDFAANFAVSMGIVRQYGNTQNNYIASRLTGTNYLQTNSDTSESSTASFVFDSNAGWNSNSNNTNISWMWKRGQGFDSVTWTGDDVAGREIRHSLNAVPEMIWVKNRGSTEPWAVYHHGANGGTTPWNYYGKLNMSSNFSNSPNMWNQTAPTSTAFTVIADNMVNGAPQTYVSYLFSSVAGISKVGSYTGTGSGLSITTGFQPRFAIIKSTSGSRNWLIFDTLRGWASGNDYELNLNKDEQQNNNYDFGAPTSTGFDVTAVNDDINANGQTYIYYAHA